MKPKIKYLEQNGIGSILDYAAESDISETHSDMDETIYYSHQQTFEKCIRAVSSVSPTGFAAVKLTSLGNPDLLMKVSNLIIELRKLFLKFDKKNSGYVTKHQFEEGYNVFFQDGDVSRLFEQIDVDHDGLVDYIEWSNGLKLEELHLLTSYCKETGPLAKTVLNEVEREQLQNMRRRIDELASLAKSLGVRLMIDAEHSYFQPAIDNITVDLQKKYNQHFPVIFGTYQMYLKDSRSRLQLDMNRARKYNYKFAAKLVRGAYMVLERNYARDHHLSDPIHDNIDDTHQNYNNGIHDVLEMIAAGNEFEVMIASHNQYSIELTLDIMSKFNLPVTKGVYFGQLLGM